MSLLAPDHGWVGERAVLDEPARAELADRLRRYCSQEQIEPILGSLQRQFGQCVEVARAECLVRSAARAEQETRGERRSPKLGVRLRALIGDLLDHLQGDDVAGPKAICDFILRDGVMASLLTVHLEEASRGRLVEPLSTAPEDAVGLLPAVLTELRVAIDAGVTTGRQEAALNGLAEAVVRALANARDKVPGRTWNPYEERETGLGLEICRIMARALNEALPPECRKDQPADMARPYRTAIKAVRSEQG